MLNNYICNIAEANAAVIVAFIKAAFVNMGIVEKRWFATWQMG